MSMQTPDIVVTVSVPTDEVEEYVARLRAGEHVVEIPEGMVCRDAFDCHAVEKSGMAVIRARYAFG